MSVCLGQQSNNNYSNFTKHRKSKIKKLCCADNLHLFQWLPFKDYYYPSMLCICHPMTSECSKIPTRNNKLSWHWVWLLCHMSNSFSKLENQKYKNQVISVQRCEFASGQQSSHSQFNQTWSHLQCWLSLQFQVKQTYDKLDKIFKV